MFDCHVVSLTSIFYLQLRPFESIEKEIVVSIMNYGCPVCSNRRRSLLLLMMQKPMIFEVWYGIVFAIIYLFF